MSTRLRVRYWVGIMSKDQVLDAVKQGYCEFKNGSEKPFKHVNPNSWFVYYSPGTKPLKVIREQGKEVGQTVQAFTAIGQVLPGEPYSIDLGNDNIVYRRNARYVPNTTDASIFPLMPKLSFLKTLTKHELWGIPLRKGLLEVLKSDFFTLCEAMNINMPKRHHLIFEQSNVNIKQEKEQKEIHHLQLDQANNGNSKKGDSTIEDRQSLDPSLDTTEQIVVKGLQHLKETNEVMNLGSNDVSETNNSIQVALLDRGTLVDPVQDSIQESKTEVNHHHHQANDDNDKENNAIVERNQQKDFHTNI